MRLRTAIRAVMSAVAIVTITDLASAQAYPAKAVRVIVSTAAGGSADTLGRAGADPSRRR